MGVPSENTALLVVDVQNDFCAPDGMMGRLGADLSQVEPAVGRIGRLIEAARAAAVPVVFVRLVTAAHTDSKAMLAWYSRQGIDASAAAVCREGTAGAEGYKLFPQKGDYVVEKQRYSAFIGTNMELVLRRLGIDKLVVTGVTTECCVESTVRDGFMLDYETFVVADGCAAYESGLHDMSLKLMGLNFASIVETESVLADWAEPKGGLR
ncbi:cysteine hydrolase family protein [Cohnella thailandensis]|uniref:Cysteine hydrolase n=1 Tax=Cohnella thailandensis TaxID=557557 RepID=A0A841T321_9BACL|nr:cysteine hydrolase [Cohnella thailandensis]MBB6636277.1 cysteine hydrolase [Cohnella thailandensis]MBP1973754.1 nicotinamidase-related amidase [Cohnella thailandensis]